MRRAPSSSSDLRSIAGAAGLNHIPVALYACSRGWVPFLLLQLDPLVIAGLDRPIGWDEIAQMDFPTGPAPTRMVVEIGCDARSGGARPGDA